MRGEPAKRKSPPPVNRVRRACGRTHGGAPLQWARAKKERHDDAAERVREEEEAELEVARALKHPEVVAEDAFKSWLRRKSRQQAQQHKREQVNRRATYVTSGRKPRLYRPQSAPMVLMSELRPDATLGARASPTRSPICVGSVTATLGRPLSAVSGMRRSRLGGW